MRNFGCSRSRAAIIWGSRRSGGCGSCSGRKRSSCRRSRGRSGCRGWGRSRRGCDHGSYLSGSWPCWVCTSITLWHIDRQITIVPDRIKVIAHRTNKEIVIIAHANVVHAAVVGVWPKVCSRRTNFVNLCDFRDVYAHG